MVAAARPPAVCRMAPATSSPSSLASCRARPRSILAPPSTAAMRATITGGCAASRCVHAYQPSTTSASAAASASGMRLRARSRRSFNRRRQACSAAARARAVAWSEGASRSPARRIRSRWNDPDRCSWQFSRGLAAGQQGKGFTECIARARQQRLHGFRRAAEPARRSRPCSCRAGISTRGCRRKAPVDSRAWRRMELRTCSRSAAHSGSHCSRASNDSSAARIAGSSSASRGAELQARVSSQRALISRRHNVHSQVNSAASPR